MTYCIHGRNACNYHTVDEEPLTALLIDALKTEILAGNRLDRLTAKVRKRLTESRQTTPKAIARRR